ncbi:MAG: helix-turn-helix domain-containing protein [Aliishimia sp.]
MAPKSLLLLPPIHLSGCMFAAIIRDTRGVTLSDEDRINYFPASPLVAVTHVIEGELRMVPSDGAQVSTHHAEPIPQQSVSLSQDTPLTSWSPGPVAAVTIGFFPDAWTKLTAELAEQSILAALAKAFGSAPQIENFETCWETFCAAISADWDRARATGGLADWSGSTRLTDWSRSLMTRAALAGSGRSIRAVERRLKRWSRQSGRSLKFYADVDNLHRLSVRARDEPLAAIATDAGYADQSHMGRAVRRVTGFSPAHLNRLIDTKEAFWCYRLLGERF